METKIVTICGSMKFAKEMIKISFDLELKKDMQSFNAFTV